MIDKWISIICRVFFVISFALLFIAIWDKFLRLFGWTLSFVPYQPARLFELSAMLIIFVLALLLRQIREKLVSQ
jgi:hypothetical protein